MVRAEVRESLAEDLSYLVDSQDQTQVIMFDGQRLYPLSHRTSLL